MVVLVDLDDDEPPSLQTPHSSGLLNVKPLYYSLETPPVGSGQGAEEIEERPNPNMNGFSAALSCYP
ncbi:Zinc finger RING FYVE PHD-type [Pyrenophora seminiperda CCB06]|uniref:Zinc finger RING FYVE PHD-type n=1 Tax=Pyrenophora seminiperda CCB06 TaxID=1302712 RepID=A0A3M7LZF8_9PLEO|nr:Zinc finger RING FYVE PHD-type [Pyrenophora seminiperda CCB06]